MTSPFKSLLITGFLLIFIAQAYSQTFTRQQVTDDLMYLRSRMEIFHPKIQLYNPDFNTKADSVLKLVHDNMSRLESFKLVSQLVALGNEGHYNVGQWNDSVHVGFLDNAYRYMPLSVYVLDGHIYVKTDVSNENALQTGDEIHSINGLSVKAILDRFKHYLPVDGHIPTRLYQRLTAGFSWLYYLYIGQPEAFEIVYTPYRETQQKTVSIEALTQYQQSENYKKNVGNVTSEPPPGPVIDDYYTYEITDGTGWLNLKSFNWQLVEKFKVDAKKLYTSIFKELNEKAVKTLVIDLRDNNGGRNEFADEMLPFILKSNSKGIYKTSISWRGKQKPFKIPSMSKYAFQGKIYVLVNAGTFSSGASLARYLREYADAVLIGSETGSRYEGFVAGSSQGIDLPNLKVRIGIPRYLTDFPPSGKQKTSNRGLMPDHTITYSIDDRIEKVDKERAFLERLLEKTE